MNGWGFFAAVIGSLAWPIAVLVIVFALRDQIRNLFTRITTLKYKDFEADFGKRLERLEEEVSAETAERPAKLLAITPEQIPVDEFDRLVELSPSAAVLRAWVGVEKMLRTMAKHHGIENADRKSVGQLTRALLTGERIDRRTAAILDDLRVLRNYAAHPSDREITVNEAMRFKTLSEEVIQLLAGSAD
jgi:hypothetical protein